MTTPMVATGRARPLNELNAAGEEVTVTRRAPNRPLRRAPVNGVNLVSLEYRRWLIEIIDELGRAE
jgi:hypothetical protein